MSLTCAEAGLLLQAELDGELDAGRAAALAVHVAGCPGCAALRDGIATASRRVRAEAPYHAAPPALRARLMARIDPVRPAAPPRRVAWWRPAAGGVLAGTALAAALAAFIVLPRGGPDPVADLVPEAVSGHLRALQAAHLLDVPSSDRHTVKPWFLGRLDFAPPVRDVAGFELLGGRLDVLDGRPVAALVYRRRAHVINLFAWPAPDAPPDAPRTAMARGYAVVRWQADGMAHLAVSDLNAGELEAFAEGFRITPR